MNPFKKGQIIKKGNDYHLVHETLGDLVFTSYGWREDSYSWREDSSEEEKQEQKEFYYGTFHYKELSDYTVVEPEWEPEAALERVKEALKG